MKKPLIGLVPLVDVGRDSYWMLPGYMDGILQAGGVPVMLPLTQEEESIVRLAEACDGFLFTGGQDVTPALYGEAPLAELGECCPMRDKMETILLDAALKADKPVFGICRGIQLLNAALGGTLYQDLPTQRPSSVVHHGTPPYDAPSHTVRLAQDAPLYAMFGPEIPVNSYHHQAVKALAPGLRVMATAPDGVVEAVWMPEKRFVWAVQWHPEFSFRSNANSRTLFSRFVEATR